jgi:hypothetical protein
MAPSRWNNQPSEMTAHNKLLGVVIVILGFAALAIAVAFADAMKVRFLSVLGTAR